MATDYRFALRCWQDKEGSDNAKVDVYVGDTKVLSEVEVSGESVDSPTMLNWESTGLADPDTGVTMSIKIVLTNNLYVDENTDRNVYCDTIGYLTKNSGGSYAMATWSSPGSGDNPDGETVETDFTSDIYKYKLIVPSTVTGDQIKDDWNDSDGTFHIISILGGDTGATVNFPMTVPSHKKA
jgi:hypothetical protein